jgi:hypothetical protein
MMAAISYSETTLLTRSIWRNIPEDDILHSKDSFGSLTGRELHSLLSYSVALSPRANYTD